MKIVFFGTSDFAVPSLKRLSSSKHKMLAVVTQPDRKKGRHLKLGPPPVKVAAQEIGLTTYQPQNVSDSRFLRTLKKFEGAGSRPDLIVVVAYGQFLSRELLEVPSIYCINLHGSLLPKYRGAAPANWAIVNGEKTTGLTVIKVNEYIDRGDMILAQEVPIKETETAIELSKRLSEVGAALLLRVVDLIEIGQATLTAQDEREATYAPKLKKEDGLINWNEPAEDIRNRVRGLIPWPTAYTYLNAKLLKIWDAVAKEGVLGAGAVEEAGGGPGSDEAGRPGAGERQGGGPRPEPGQILSLSKVGIVVATGKGNLVIKVLQLEGSRKMDSSAFLAGHKIEVGEMLERREKGKAKEMKPQTSGE